MASALQLLPNKMILPLIALFASSAVANATIDPAFWRPDSLFCCEVIQWGSLRMVGWLLMHSQRKLKELGKGKVVLLLSLIMDARYIGNNRNG